MKVSILTYHWEDNYGATLQAYATYRAIASLGHEPEFIDLRLPYAPSIVSRLVFALKRHRFNNFRNKFFKNLTDKTYYSVDELRKDPPESDCYLVGSDQTWNPQIAKKLLPAFFLTFGPEEVKRLSYATSIGLNQWEKSDYISYDEIRNAIAKFDSLLLRETSALEICHGIFGREARQVVDPVLLFKDYPELTGDIKPSGEVITYKLIDDPEFYDMARDVAASLNLPIRSIGSVRHPKGFRAAYPESVERWVRRLASAEYMLTDSFHGTVFSLLYHRPFVIYVGDPNRVTRIKSLLEPTGLSDRILNHGATTEDMIRIANTPIDWEFVDKKLETMRAESLNLLKESLK